MPVPVDVQGAITERYSELANSITHAELGIDPHVLAKHFVDRSKMKLASFDYDPLTVVVQRMTSSGNAVIVRAEYVGVHGHNVVSTDVWERQGLDWVLVSRR